MQWFGKAHGAPYELDTPHAPTPEGRACAWCDERIEGDDDGFLIPYVSEGGARDLPWHYECRFRTIVGGLNHQRGHCVCCGGADPPDPPWLSRRTAAIVATQEHQNKRWEAGG